MSAQQDALPGLALFSLGGTIAMAGGAGASPAMGAEQLAAAVPALAEMARIDFQAVTAMGSPNLDLDIVIDLARRIDRSKALAHVVTTGTDTLEEVAFALDLMLGGQARTVVTGAMRPADRPGADGPANLLSAVRIALSDDFAGRGVAVVLGERIFAPRSLTKSATHRPDAFVAVDELLAGQVVEDRVLFGGLLRRPVWIDPIAIGPVPPVALIEAGFGDDGRAWPSLAEQGYKAAVIAGFGGGHLSEKQAEKAEHLAQQMPVVIASRTGGEMLAKSYAYPGAEMDLLARGLISAGRYGPRKARLIIALGLASGWQPDQIASALQQ